MTAAPVLRTKSGLRNIDQQVFHTETPGRLSSAGRGFIHWKKLGIYNRESRLRCA